MRKIRLSLCGERRVGAVDCRTRLARGVFSFSVTVCVSLLILVSSQDGRAASSTETDSTTTITRVQARESVRDVGAGSRDRARRPAVARPNLRFATGYSYVHVDETRTSFFRPFAGTTTTLELKEADVHSIRAEIVGVIPVIHSLGLRGRVRGSYGGSRYALDLLDPEKNGFESGRYGVSLEAFLRDPDLGSIVVGSSFDRVDGGDKLVASEFGGLFGASIFFPDFGSGAVDWSIRFDYLRRKITGPGSLTDVDFYSVEGSAGWYMTENFQLELGGRWIRSETGIVSEDDREGFVNLRWLIPAPVSFEFSLGGSAGVSEYKEVPFRPDSRLRYGANLGFTFRFQSGPNLIETRRAYD